MWKDEFDRNLYFSHGSGRSNLCGVLIEFSDSKTFTVKKTSV